MYVAYLTVTHRASVPLQAAFASAKPTAFFDAPEVFCYERVRSVMRALRRASRLMRVEADKVSNNEVNYEVCVISAARARG
jgi:hypothetical protein